LTAPATEATLSLQTRLTHYPTRKEFFECDKGHPVTLPAQRRLQSPLIDQIESGVSLHDGSVKEKSLLRTNHKLERNSISTDVNSRVEMDSNCSVI